MRTVDSANKSGPNPSYFGGVAALIGSVAILVSGFLSAHLNGFALFPLLAIGLGVVLTGASCVQLLRIRRRRRA
jgi:hypothetical protein